MYKLLRTCTPHINREFLKRQHQKPCQNKGNTQKKFTVVFLILQLTEEIKEEIQYDFSSKTLVEALNI